MKKGLLAVISTVLGAATGASLVFKMKNDRMKKEIELDGKNDAILGLYNQWMSSIKEGKNVADYLKNKGYKTIAIYGMHYMGETLYEQLNNTGISVKYGIDRNADKLFSDIDILGPEDELPEVDAIIVTAFYYFDEIETKLSEKTNCPILSIEDILYQI